ncbi:MAG: capsular biosynthesis protein [Clostridium butyricum]|nr:capsular biosynthesis protein [Clostridium butyricum]
MEDQNISLKDLFDIIGKRFKLMYFITIVTVMIVTINNLFLSTPMYEVSTMVFAGKSASDNDNYTSNDIEMYKNLIQSYIKLINTNDLIENALRKNDINMETSNILDNLTVNQSDDSQIIEIKYKSNDKYLAKNIVEDITAEFIKEANQLVPNGNIKIIEHSKLPKTYIKPKKISNIIISFIVSILVGFGIVLFLETINKTVRNKETIEKFIKIPVIGVIPNESKKG